jgi:hypothetical protein
MEAVHTHEMFIYTRLHGEISQKTSSLQQVYSYTFSMWCLFFIFLCRCFPVLAVLHVLYDQYLPVFTFSLPTISAVHNNFWNVHFR